MKNTIIHVKSTSKGNLPIKPFTPLAILRFMTSFSILDYIEKVQEKFK